MSKKSKDLKFGFTTGTAAAAAAKGALSLLLEEKAPLKVKIELLTGRAIDIPLQTCEQQDMRTATCTVVKDAGDDPDVTHKAVIGARVMFLDDMDFEGVVITGGKGVGKVTKPGLEIPPGEPAINLGPRKMITQAVNEVLKKHRINPLVKVEIFVPEGEKMALKTLNARLGILGGISILGTTGVVTPMSHEAYIATIRSSVSVARATGQDSVVLTTGRRSEKFAQVLFDQLSEDAFIQIGDFFKMSVEEASKNGFERIILAVFFGKAVKMAQGVPHTHAAKSTLNIYNLAAWAFEVTQDHVFSDKISSCNTARHAFDFIVDKYPEIISHVGKLMVKSAKRFAEQNVHIQGIILDYNGDVLFDSDLHYIPRF